MLKHVQYWPSKFNKRFFSLNYTIILSRGLCLHGPNYLVKIINNLMSYLCAPYDCQKISVTAFFAEVKVILFF